VSRPSPLLGYNTGVQHKDATFHIQTEDSGIDHPYVTTHLFADGGRIVATRRTSYAEHVDTPAYPEVVRDLIKAQHKAMYLELRRGELDEQIALATSLEPAGRIAIPTLRAAGDHGGVAPAPAVRAEPRPPAAPPPARTPLPVARQRRSGTIATILVRDSTEISLAEIILYEVAPRSDPERER
jgi:hypothetical protein